MPTAQQGTLTSRTQVSEPGAGKTYHCGNEAKLGMESWANVEPLEMAVRWRACAVVQIPVSL
jgi:hypothetical protein